MLRARAPCFAPVWCWPCEFLAFIPTSELRAAIHADGIAGDPTRVLRGEERHHRADIIGLADPLERLHAENRGLALVSLDEVRHIGVDHARRDRVDADAARPERRREILHQRVDRALRGRIGRQGADGGVRPEGRDENYAAALAQYRKAAAAPGNTARGR